MENLIKKINVLINNINLNQDPCDVCGSAFCLCSYLPACGGKELEDWSEEELYNEYVRLTILSLNNFYREEAEKDLPSTYCVDEDMPF